MDYTEIEKLLLNENIQFKIPSAGCYKITAPLIITLMFYPKSGTLIWKKNKNDFQHKYNNSDLSNIIKKIKSILEG